MKLLELDQLEVAGEDLQNFNLTINDQQELGLKLNHEQTQALFKLLSTKKSTLNGQLIMTERTEDGFYEKLTLKQYLSFLKRVANSKQSLMKLLCDFILEDQLSQRINQLTIDQKQRLKLLRLVIFDPKLIIIDSPLQDLSVDGRKDYLKVLATVRKSGKTVVFVSSYLEELLLLCKSIYQYDGKQLVPVKMDNDSEVRISSHVNDKTYFFVPAEIDFVESINGVSNLVVADEYYPTKLTLDKLEQQLINKGFFRCHRSYLVRVNLISEIVSYSKNSYNVVLKDDRQTNLPLSRSKVEQLKELLK